MADNFFPWGAVFSADTKGKKTGDGPAFGRSTSWKLYSIYTSSTRLWACSSARFVITRSFNLGTDGVFGQMLDVRQEFLQADLPLPEDPIVIEGGYSNSLYTDAVAGTRMFYGYIDTMNVAVNPKGIKVTMSCRDPMRFLIDNKFSGSIFGSGLKIQAETGFDDQRGAAAQPLTFQEVDDALGVGAGTPNSVEGGALTKEKVIAWLIYAGSNGGCLPGVIIDPGADIPLTGAIERSSRRFVAQTDLDGEVAGFNIMDKSPIEVIKHLGALEAEPRELYASMDSGCISWVRRETTNYDNPVREYSAVFPFPQGSQFAGDPPNVLSSTMDWSTIGTISELIIVNPTANNASTDQGLNDSGTVNISGRLPDDRFFSNLISDAFDGLRHFTRRTRYIFDDTMNPSDPQGAMALIDAMFRIWGKDLKAGTLELKGDPTLQPAEAFKGWNLGMFSGEVFRVEAVEHVLIAVGPKRGFRTRLAFAEPDEKRNQTLNKVIQGMGKTEFYTSPLTDKGKAVNVQLSPTLEGGDSSLGN